MKKGWKLIIICLMILSLNWIQNVYADDIKLSENYTVYWDDVVNTGKDNGYSKSNIIENGDPHYGIHIMDGN